MNDFSHNDDQPISEPSQDRFGMNPFAQTLAKSIRKMKSPVGSVIALNGPWGVGKSSAVNLIRCHLQEAVKAEEITIIDFRCWWFRGEEALVLAFFRELYAGLSPTLGEKLKKSLPKLGAHLLSAGSFLGRAADLAGAGGAGEVVGDAMKWLSGLIQQDESVEKLHAELSKTLKEQSRRFLVIIDDIDRLSPDEALLIFRLVKSVGCLPNVIYLLVYDRQLAEKIVSERFPSEGPHYLEKIVQAAFELPAPTAFDLNQLLREQIESICGELPADREHRFMILFYQGVAPEMRTPRDVVRFTSSLAVTWPAVVGEVDLADFIVLEVLRLFNPDVYRAIQQNKDRVFSLAREEPSEYDELLLRLFAGAKRERLRSTLAMLFPILASIWGKGQYAGYDDQWARDRRVCSLPHFYAYFRFTIGTEVLSTTELDAFIAKASDPEFVKAALLKAVTVARPAGGTKAAVILDELNLHAEKVDRAHIQPLLTALFEVADEINVEEDHARDFCLASNELRLIQLSRSLTTARFSLNERSALFVAACQSASLGWLGWFATSVWQRYDLSDGRAPAPEKHLATPDDAKELRNLFGKRIAEAAENGELIGNRDLAILLEDWCDLTNDEGATVKAWTAHQLANDESIKYFCVAFTTHGWRQELGDLVAKRTTGAQVKNLERLMDVAEFRRRVEEIDVAGGSPEVSEFLDAWRRKDQAELPQEK